MFMRPLVRAFLYSLRLYAQLVCWAYDAAAAPLPSLRPGAGSSTTDPSVVVTPALLREALLDFSAHERWWNELERAPIQFWAQDRHAWMLWASACWAERVGTLLHETRFSCQNSFPPLFLQGSDHQDQNLTTHQSSASPLHLRGTAAAVRP